MARLKGIATNLGVAVVAVGLLLVAFELTLRISGFSFVLYPEKIEFGGPNLVEFKEIFRPDDDLFWVTKDYDAELEYLRENRPDIIFMGDSCTHIGSYDVAFADLFDREGRGPLVYGNVAVSGWSTYQGLRQLERDVLDLNPAIATIYFGWNDHWIGFGIEDKNVARVKRIFSSRWSHFRLIQLATKVTVAWGARKTDWPERVSIPDFQANLSRMIDLMRAQGITPVLISAASSHTPGTEPSFLADRWLKDLSDLIPLHNAYTDALRETAREKDAVLCDVALEIDGLAVQERKALFMADGIHWLPEGSRRLGGMLHDCLEQNDLIEKLL